MDDFDDLTRTVSARRSAARPSAAERPAPSATPDVYEARQAAGAAAERSARSTQTFSSTLSILAVGALIGFLAGFWLFRDRD